MCYYYDVMRTTHSYLPKTFFVVSIILALYFSTDTAHALQSTVYYGPRPFPGTLSSFVKQSGNFAYTFPLGLETTALQGGSIEISVDPKFETTMGNTRFVPNLPLTPVYDLVVRIIPSWGLFYDRQASVESLSTFPPRSLTYRGYIKVGDEIIIGPGTFVQSENQSLKGYYIYEWKIKGWPNGIVGGDQMTKLISAIQNGTPDVKVSVQYVDVYNGEDVFTENAPHFSLCVPIAGSGTNDISVMRGESSRLSIAGIVDKANTYWNDTLNDVSPNKLNWRELSIAADLTKYPDTAGGKPERSVCPGSFIWFGKEVSGTVSSVATVSAGLVLSALSNNKGELTLSWTNENLPTVSSFDIEKAIMSNFGVVYNRVGQVAGDTNTYIDRNILPAVSANNPLNYSYRVRAKLADGSYTDYSNVIGITIANDSSITMRTVQAREISAASAEDVVPVTSPVRNTSFVMALLTTVRDASVNVVNRVTLALGIPRIPYLVSGPTYTVRPSPSFYPTPIVVGSVTPRISASPTIRPSVIATPFASVVFSPTPVRSPTVTPVATIRVTPRPSISYSPTPSRSPIPTYSPRPSSSYSPRPSLTYSPSPTYTYSPSSSVSASPTPSPSSVQDSTSGNIGTGTPSPSPTSTSTPTPPVEVNPSSSASASPLSVFDNSSLTATVYQGIVNVIDMLFGNR